MIVSSIIIVTHALLLNAYNITESTMKIKYILSEYKSSLRQARSVDVNSKKYIDHSLLLFKDTERYVEFLKYMNVSACSHSDSANNSAYVKRHVLYGLITDRVVPESHWREYKSVFNKSYISGSHERAAQHAWRDNLELVASHNQNYLRGRKSYILHLNSLSDMHPFDYVNNLLKLISTPPLPDPSEDRRKTTYLASRHHIIPKRVDWRAMGYRPLREEQWRCGACYAFAVAHAVQAQMFKKHRRWRELSPQQIVDCSGVDGNMGCEGGSLRATLRYAAREGLQSELEYPYFGRKGRCRYNRRRVKARAARWAMLPRGDERALQRALATIGPLAVAVNASPRSFQLYRSGIYDDPLCIPFVSNHAMLLVGYTPKYWVLLNWWGRKWGEDGYMRLRRGLNRCGVANMAAYVDIM